LTAGEDQAGYGLGPRERKDEGDSVPRCGWKRGNCGVLLRRVRVAGKWKKCIEFYVSLVA
jgi:hypothetical protein